MCNGLLCGDQECEMSVIKWDGKCICIAITFAVMIAFLPISLSIMYLLNSHGRSETEENNVVMYISSLAPGLSILQKAFQDQNQQQAHQLERIQQYQQVQVLLIEELAKFNRTRSILPLQQQLHTVQMGIQEEKELLSRQMAVGKSTSSPIESCSSLSPHFPSGYYYIRAPDGSRVLHYCEKRKPLCGDVGDWMRVAELDMRNSSQFCPSELNLLRHQTLRSCVRPTISGGCTSLHYNTPGFKYKRICGKVLAYQVGSPNAFGARSGSDRNINAPYVDGVSITHGNPRQHIWTFASSRDEAPISNAASRCPCILGETTVADGNPPAFVGNNYFCDTASTSNNVPVGRFYYSDPLWDGAGCGGINQCCSFNSPPWFHVILPNTITDAIELRVCRDQEDEDIALATIEIYVW